MMLSGDNLSVATAICAVVTGFREADTLVQRLKVSCVSKHVGPPPDLLEHTIIEAPGDIERVQQRGIERCGRAFEQGDHIAVIAIQQVTIQLQTGLLGSLRAALASPEVAEYTSIIDYAESAHDGVITALMSLRKRLVESNAVYQPIFEPVATRQPSIVPTIPERDGRRPPRVWSDPYFPNRGNERAMSASPPPVVEHQRTGSLLGLLKRQSMTPTPPPQDQYAGISNRRPIPASAIHPAYRTAADTQYTISPIEQTNPAFNAYDNPYHTYHQQSQNSSTYSRSTYSPLSESSRTNSILSAQTTAPTTPSTHQMPTPSLSDRLAIPTPENSYLGFCPGAWRVQTGDPKAMVERRDFTQSAQSQLTYPSCSKCAFRGHVTTKVIWNKVFEDNVRGLKYRWAFLAKSHVKQKNVREKNYAYHCLFCVFAAAQKKHFVYTLETYLDHLVLDHRGQGLDDVMLYRTNCVNDRVCGNGERFDVNIFPPPAATQGALRSKGEDGMEELAVDLKSFELAA